MTYNPGMAFEPIPLMECRERTRSPACNHCLFIKTRLQEGRAGASPALYFYAFSGLSGGSIPPATALNHNCFDVCEFCKRGLLRAAARRQAGTPIKHLTRVITFGGSPSARIRGRYFFVFISILFLEYNISLIFAVRQLTYGTASERVKR